MTDQPATGQQDTGGFAQDEGPPAPGRPLSRPRPGVRTLGLILAATAAGLVAFVAWKIAASSRETAAATPPPADVRKVIPSLVQAPPRPEPAPVVAVAAPPPSPRVAAPARAEKPAQHVKTEAELLRERQLSPALQRTGSAGGTGDSTAARITRASADSPADDARADNSPLGKALAPVTLNGSRAGQLANRDTLLTRGEMIDCVLETKIVSTRPGMVVCHITRDIWSTSGRVVLLDRGSRVTGAFQGGITQGEARIFVAWQRVETPAGVIIDLNSPATGPLGEAGIGGWVDTHFWERFGGAVMISLIGDIGSAAASAASSSAASISLGGTASGTENAAAEALKNSINIPPTLILNQGARVAVLVARDLDFGGVYDLEPSP